ncbi:MAG: hypothetical protein ACRYGR_01600 [Janthinobacterium lividum]
MFFVWAIAALIVSAIISYATQPRATVPTPNTIGDFKLPVPDQGTPIVVVFGDVWIDDWSVLWYGNLRNVAIKAGSGGKK